MYTESTQIVHTRIWPSTARCRISSEAHETGIHLLVFLNSLEFLFIFVFNKNSKSKIVNSVVSSPEFLRPTNVGMKFQDFSMFRGDRIEQTQSTYTPMLTYIGRHVNKFQVKVAAEKSAFRSF